MNECFIADYMACDDERFLIRMRFRNLIDKETIAFMRSQNVLLDRKRLILGEVIGQGHFGMVHRGTLLPEDKQCGEEKMVAIKTMMNSKDCNNHFLYRGFFLNLPFLFISEDFNVEL